ncbi:hypothetical protein QJS83_16855 [Bdellovibrio sp. 22V]|uniref:hypothetical protein n=1 Tax=Bdellovibrio sp. 22V TaxID=3044166 RepID=UPI0025431496|nr:hypothetical protein [Bdellovibrio sp. 22V]WII72134.1 hypothetical protein QJS83_16855 [Bdellovibrio sp. 22V]
MTKPIYTFALALLFSLNTMAESAAGTAAAAIEPYTPAEANPTGLEEVEANLTAIVTKMSALPANAAAAGAKMTIPELTVIKAGLELYRTNRETCIADQVRASNFCREETSPHLQTAAQGINLALAGINAANDSCKAFSKAMSVAQAGLTAYTAACGVLRKKCNMSCTAAASGMKKILEGLVATGATCVPTNPAAGAVCPGLIGNLESLKKAAYGEVKKEASLSDKRSLHSKEKMCQHTYGLLLLSSGASILSLAKSVKEGKDCDEQTDGAAVSGGGTATTPSQTPPAGVETEPAPAQSSTNHGILTTPTNVQPPPVAESSQDSRQSMSLNSDRSGLRAYLPGGSKAVVEAKPLHPDITSAGGKTNFQKMRIRFQELRLNSED